MTVPFARRSFMPTQRAAQASIAAALFLLFALCFQGCTTAEPEVYRGREIRSEIVDRNVTSRFRVELAGSASGELRLRFNRISIVTEKEVPIHEKVLLYRTDGERDGDRVRYKPVIGEFMRGEPRRKTRKEESGPLANDVFLIGDRRIRTNSAGLYTDKEEYILSQFDDLRVQEIDLLFENPQHGQHKLVLTRQEMLSALDVNDARRGNAGSSSVTVDVALPDRVQPGDHIDATIRVLNTGSKRIVGARACLISRFNWISGTVFYLGSIAPGQEATFSRRLVVPEDAPSGTVFATAGGWNILGPMPDVRFPIEIVVEKAAAR